MSVLIKGAKMPPTCRDCFVMCDNYDKKTWRYERHKDCPLVSVPTLHGRLVDIDAEVEKHGCIPILGEHLKAMAKHMTTVIESEDWHGSLY